MSLVKTSKLKVKVVPGSEAFVAGGEVFGHFQVQSDEGFRAKLGNYEVLIGEIGVELIAYEETGKTKDGHDQRSFTFLYGRHVFQQQAEMHPLKAQDEQIITSAVVHDPPPDGDGFWQPTKGTTSFPFAFELPKDCPSSGEFGLGRVRYVVTAYVHCKLQGSIETVAHSVQLQVSEFWDKGNPAYARPISGTAGRDISNYEEVFVEAKINKSLFVTGDKLTGTVRVSNHSKHKVREVKMTLVNRLTMFADRRNLPDGPGPGRAADNDKADNDTGGRRGSIQVDNRSYAGPREDLSYEIAELVITEPKALARDQEESWPFSIDLPKSGSVLSLRNLALFEVTPQLVIKVSRGPLSKSTKLHLPPFAVTARESLLERHQQPRSAQIWASSDTQRPGVPLPPCEPYTFSRLRGGVRSPNVEKAKCVVVVRPEYYLDARQRIRVLDPSFV